MLPVEQAHDFQLVRVGRRRHDDVAGLEIGMLDTEMMEGRVLGDERGCDEKVAFEIPDVVRR